MKPINALLACLLLVAAPASASSDAAPGERQGAPPAVRLTLDEAISRGIEASNRLAELRAREDSARAAVKGSDAAGMPEIGFQAGYMRTNHVEPFGITLPNGVFREIYPDIPDNYRARLDLQWRVYTSGRVQAASRAASLEVEAVSSESAAARGDVRLEITRAWWALVTATEAERVVQAAVERIDAHLSDVRARRKAGLVPDSDVLSVAAQRSRQEVLLIEARNARELAAADLRRLVGLEPDTPLELGARLDAVPGPPAPVEALVAEARMSRPEPKAIEWRVEAAGRRVAAAEASTRPVVAIAGGVDYARPNPRIFPRSRDFRESWDASVNVVWPFWDGGRAKAQAAEAVAARSALEARLREFDSVVEVEIRQRRFDLEAGRASVAAAEDAVRSASEARRMVRDRYAAGVATNSEVLDAEFALLQAELDRTRALANAHLAAARLERAVGR